MTLEPDEVDLFYHSMFGLLDYVNGQKHVVELPRTLEASMGIERSVDTRNVTKIAAQTWGDPGMIDGYLASRQDLPEENRKLVASWKNAVSGLFFADRILKKGVILVDLDNEKAYQVSGIISDWDELLMFRELPCLLSINLLPFGDRIIYDSCFEVKNVFFGPGTRRAVKEAYSEARKAGRVYSWLPEGSPKPKPMKKQ